MWKRVGKSYFDAIENSVENATIFDDAYAVISNVTDFIDRMAIIEMEVTMTYHKNYFSETNVTADGKPKDIVSVQKWSTSQRNDLTVVSKPSTTRLKVRVNLSTSVCDETYNNGFYS
jgi:hypothetical protein